MGFRTPLPLLQVSGWQGVKELHSHGGSVVAYTGMVDCFVRTVREEGVQALFKVGVGEGCARLRWAVEGYGGIGRCCGSDWGGMLEACWASWMGGQVGYCTAFCLGRPNARWRGWVACPEGRWVAGARLLEPGTKAIGRTHLPASRHVLATRTACRTAVARTPATLRATNVWSTMYPLTPRG